MEYLSDLTNVRRQTGEPLGRNFQGDNGKGLHLEVTSRDLRLNGVPTFGVTGEAHYARIAEDQFEDTVIKMKMGGLNVVATYVFWIVHEEREGVFRFDGNRNVRKFIALCHKHGLFVILRIGPFDHGEMRNGGLPDWLYGKPFECRNDSKGYLTCVRRLYAAIHEQVDGLYFDQGGPIIGIQVENEYMHSSAPWEITTGISNEWVPGGSDGEKHMASLKALAKEVGIRAPFYTCTAWGGAITPDDMLPLWGGYAYWPWHFYGQTDEPHPVTEEYIYRDNHNNEVPRTYNFEPRFPPESRPYACCEMMGGMFCSYHYRYILPFESVDAMASIKLGSGCTLLGYYMYRGGTTPKGETTAYLNESQTPRLSYDFQAPIGEYGQTRPSFHRLRALHTFCHTFSEFLCETRTAVPDWMEALDPRDKEKLRYCVRVKDGSGFVFLNNFQDHAEMADKSGESIRLRLPEGDLVLEELSLAAGENAILPFNLDLGGALLRYATAQPLSKLEDRGTNYWFFFTPEGMEGRYHFRAADVDKVFGCGTEWKGDALICRPAAGKSFTIESREKKLVIVTLTREESLKFYQLPLNGRETAFLSDAALLWDGRDLKAETEADCATVMAFPPLPALREGAPSSRDLFRGYTYPMNNAPVPIPAKQVGTGRYTLALPADQLTGHKTALLRLQYAGDIGHAFIDGDMIGDNFCNGAPWDVRVDPFAGALAHQPLTVYITPLKEKTTVNVDSPMAARMERADGLIAELQSAELHFVDEIAVWKGGELP